ncbi:MAG: glycosyltransferase [Alteromonadaceae bacterium]|nr:glycosyltransferase [Alteromonadaceae bacterium]
MSSELISVVIPVYNSEKHIEETLHSIRKQTYQNIEILCVDDGSSDNSAFCIEQISKVDSRVKLIQMPENGGISKALNTGIEMAKGRYIARMDSDDIALPTRIAEQKNYLEEHKNVQIVGSWIQLFGAQDTVWHYRQADEFIKALFLFRSNGVPHNSILVRKALYEEFNYDSAYDNVEDTELWCRIVIEKPNYVFANIPKVMTYYRMHEQQTSSIRKERQMKLYRKIIKNYVESFCGVVSEEELTLHYYFIDMNDQLDSITLEKVGKWKQRLRRCYQTKLNDAYLAIEEKWLLLCRKQSNKRAMSVYREYSDTEGWFCFL